MKFIVKDLKEVQQLDAAINKAVSDTDWLNVAPLRLIQSLFWQAIDEIQKKVNESEQEVEIKSAEEVLNEVRSKFGTRYDPNYWAAALEAMKAYAEQFKPSVPETFDVEKYWDEHKPKWGNDNLDLRTLLAVRDGFRLHSDNSCETNGYRSLVEMIIKAESEQPKSDQSTTINYVDKGEWAVAVPVESVQDGVDDIHWYQIANILDAAIKIDDVKTGINTCKKLYKLEFNQPKTNNESSGEDVEDAAEKYGTSLSDDPTEQGCMSCGFKAGAEWQRNQINSKK